jgi:hypothetical protein
MRANTRKLNALQLKTLAILQAMARDRDFADPADAGGLVSIHTLPHAHGDHVHIGGKVVSVRDATGLGNQNVMNALARKGLLMMTSAGLPTLTAEGLGYETGVADRTLHGSDH